MRRPRTIFHRLAPRQPRVVEHELCPFCGCCTLVINELHWFRDGEWFCNCDNGPTADFLDDDFDEEAW